MFCNQCGKEIELGGSFCKNCGAPVEGFQKIPPPQRQKRLNGSSASRMTGKQWFGIILSVFATYVFICGLVGVSFVIAGKEDTSELPPLLGFFAGGLTFMIVGFKLFRGRKQGAIDHTKQEENTKNKIEQLEREIEELKKQQK